MRREQANGAGSRELAELSTRVQKWREREGGGRGSRIPEELWLEAIRVVRIAGLYATAQAAHFNYQRLKERSEGGAASDGAEDVGDGNSRFIALRMAPPSAAAKTTIEVWGRQGDRMRVDVTGETDVAALLQTFWGRPS